MLNTVSGSPNVDQIVSILKRVLSNVSPGESVELHQPWFRGNEWRYVKDCLDTGWVSSVGQYVTDFERKLAEFTGVARAVAVVNGTAALQIALQVAGVNPDTEVLVPSLTFVATVNAIAHTGAVPHFVDSEHSTLGVDPEKLESYLKQIAELRDGVTINRETGRRLSALIVVHTMGHPARVDLIADICDRYKLSLIEDAAESIGSLYRGRHTGVWGQLSTLSFNGNKTITTGGGGAILTDDIQLADLAKHLTTTAKISHPYKFFHDMVGYNFRLPNINAAIGCAQMELLPDFVRRKRRLAHRYLDAFKEVDGVSVFQEPEFATSNYWLNVLMLDKPSMIVRDQLLEASNLAGIKTRPAWELISSLPMYQNNPKMDLANAENISARLVNLPSSPSLIPLSEGEA